MSLGWVKLSMTLLHCAFISAWRHLQELSDIAPVHTHRGHFGAAMLMEFVAACLATETIQKKLLANITECQLQICFPNLKKNSKINTVILIFQQ